MAEFPVLLVLGASNSKNSINKRFAVYASGLMRDINAVVLDLNDFDLPIFSVDLEKEIGIPEPARKFKERIENADAILISLAEHNSSYTAAYKNLVDWTSRLEGKIWGLKKIFLLSTSPGKRGGASVMESALKSYPYMGAEILGYFSLPSFYEHFDKSNQVSDDRMRMELIQKLTNFREQLNSD